MSSIEWADNEWSRRLDTMHRQREEQEDFLRKCRATETAIRENLPVRAPDIRTEQLTVVRLTELLKRLSGETRENYIPEAEILQDAPRNGPDRSLVQADRLAVVMLHVLERDRSLLSDEVYGEMKTWISFIRQLSLQGILVDMDC
jgi:hypothetical protein